LIKKRHNVNKEWFQDPSGHKYGRILGALAWPYAGKPGVAVVVAEDFFKDDQMRLYHLRVLKEIESLDAATLIRICQDWQAECLVEDWLGDIGNRPMMSIYYQLTIDQPAERRFNLCRASHSQDRQALGYYLSVIKEYLRSGKKSLHFVSGSKILAYLAQISTDVMGESADNHPPVAALGYVLSYFFEDRRETEEEDEHSHKGYTGASETTGY
jgi:hypothetical protein